LFEERKNDAANQASRPSVCRNCGAIVAAGENVCPQCDTVLVLGAVDERRLSPRDREALRFARAVLTRPATFSLVFLIANIFVFLLTMMAGGLQGEAEGLSVLIAYGAKVNRLIDERGEWWRFVAPIFLHGGIAHIFMNMYGLWVLGPYVEKLYGSAKFVVFWIVSGVAGVVASYLSVQPDMAASGVLGRFLFKAQDAVSVGASGALFGLVGVLFVFGIKFRHELPEGFKQAFGTGMLPTILLNVFIGYIVPVIDNAAHLGGMVAGAGLALLVSYKRPSERRAPVAVFWHILQIAALLLVVVSFVMVARHFTSEPPVIHNAVPRTISAEERAAQSFTEAMSDGQRAFITVFNERDTEAVDRAIQKLNDTPPLGEQPDALRDELRRLLERARDFAATAQNERQTPRQRQEAQQLVTDYQMWQERFAGWLREDGPNYGLQLRAPEPQASPSVESSRD
jgi:rhomboid protease GluP